MANENAGLTLREIIMLADTLVPNNVQLASKIIWINQIMNQAYRDYPTLQAVQTYSITAGKEMYTLPPDCPEDRLSYLMFNDDRYEFISGDVDGELEVDSCITVLNGVAMVIYPTPKVSGMGFLFYKPRPNQLAVGDMDKKPNYPADFHEMLVSGLAARLAKASPETLGLVAIHESDFARMADKADMVLIKSRQKKVMNVRSWS